MVRYVPEVRSKLCTVNLVVKHTQIVYGESVPKSYQAETMNLIAIWCKIGYNSAKNSVFEITWVPGTWYICQRACERAYMNFFLFKTLKTI